MSDHKFILPAEVDTAPRTDGKKRDGRWKLNAGSVMQVVIPDLSDDLVDVVLDLESCTFSKKSILALSEHDKRSVVGKWEDLQADGTGVYGDLFLVDVENENEAVVLSEAIRFRALVRNQVPVEVSVGVHCGEKGHYEEVHDKAVVNGRLYEKGDRPLYILRNGVIYESSLCSFGADSDTGKIAATSHKPGKKETTMSDKLKVLLAKFAEKHHGLVARCVAEGVDEAVITTKVQEADHSDALRAKDQEIETLKASLQAKDQEIETLKAAKTETTKVSETSPLDAKGSEKGVRFGATEGGKPTGELEAKKAGVKTMTDAIQFCREQNKELKGLALRKEARRLFPQAEDR